MVGVVVVSYKSYKDTADYVLNQLSKLDVDLHVVLVDVGVSTRNEALIFDQLKYDFDQKSFDFGVIKQLTFLSFKENLGYAKGNMKGLDYLKTNSKKIKYVLISNNDIIIRDTNIISVLIDVIEGYDNAVSIGPKVIGLDGLDQSPHKKMSIWSMIVFPKLFWFLQFLRKNFVEVIPNANEGTYYRLMGSFFLIDLEKFMGSGGFDLNTFLYGEELILAEIFIKNKLLTIYTDQVSVVHNHNQTISKHIKSSKNDKIFQESLLYYFKRYRNASNISLNIAKISILFNQNSKFLIRKLIQNWK